MSFLPNNAFFQCPSWGSFWVASIIASIIMLILSKAGNETLMNIGGVLCGLSMLAYAIWGMVQFFSGSPNCAYAKFPGQNGWNPLASTVARIPENP